MSRTGDLRVDSIMPRLFKSWEILPFEECLLNRAVSYKKLKKKDIRQLGKIPVVDQGENFISGYTDNENNAYVGTLPVIVFGDHTRRVKYINFKFAVGAEGIKLLHPFKALYPKFFFFYLSALKLESQGYSRHYRFLKQINIPIPPHNEQRRIVVKLEKLLTKVDACKERLEKIPIILKRFRQSVLAAACSGRLTADWREKNPDIVSVNEVLDNIQKRRLNLASSLREKKRIEDIYSCQEKEDSDLLPISWKYVGLDKLCESFQYGTSRKSESSGKVAVLRMGNIQNGEINWDDLIYTSHEEEIEKYRLEPGDVLFNRTNSPELVGKTSIYRGKPPAIFAGYLIRINNFKELNSEYLNYCLNSSYAKEYCLRVKTDGVHQSNINAQKLAKFEVPFCSAQEQQEIVRRVEALFKVAEQIEERYKKAKAYVDRLTQSILAKAFRGELVPQDPNDEPASVLLERIREERGKKQDRYQNRKARTRRQKLQNELDMDI